MNCETSKTTHRLTLQSPSNVRPLARGEIAGHFSLLGNGPVSIDATPGLRLHVRAGMVQICHPEEDGHQLVQAGDTFVVNDGGPLTIAAITRSEIHLQWPLVAARLVRGHIEPSTAYAFA